MRVPQRNATPTQPQPARLSRMHLINHHRQFWVPCELAKHAKVTCLQQQLQHYGFGRRIKHPASTAFQQQPPSQLQPCLGRIHPTQAFNLTTWPHMARPRQPHSSFVPFGWTDRTPSSFTSVACASLFTAHHRSIPLLRYYLITFFTLLPLFALLYFI